MYGVSKMILGLGKDSWRQGRGEVIDILRRCFWRFNSILLVGGLVKLQGLTRSV